MIGALLLMAAAPVPAMIGTDPRVSIRDYAENQVITFAARPNYQSTIQFGDEERIENIAVGESGAWQITPNRRANLLFVKPTSAKAPVTNMTVVTDRHTYLFELRSSTGARPLYLLRFAYAPDPVATPPIPKAQEAGLITTVQTTPVPDRLSHLNFAWTVKGAKTLMPERIFDDGHSVYLSWAPGRSLPAILAPAPDGKTEAPVNYNSDGDYLVVDGFHKRLILRAGRDMVALETTRPSPADAADQAQAK